MFVSAGLELRVHSFSEEGVSDHPVQYPPSKSKVTKVSICKDNSYILLLRQNEKPQIISVKDRRNMRLIHTINVADVTAITFKRNTKKTIAMGTGHGDVVLYDTKTRNVCGTVSKACCTVRDLDFTCDDRKLCCLDHDTLLVFPDVSLGPTAKRYRQPSECSLLRCHPFIPSKVVVAMKTGRVTILDVAQEAVTFSASVFDRPLTGVALSSCGRFLVAAGKDVKVCGVDDDRSPPLRLEQEREVTAVDLSPDDRFLAVGLCDGTLKMYDVRREMKLVHCSRVDPGPVAVVAFENGAKETNSNFSTMMRLAAAATAASAAGESKETNGDEEGGCCSAGGAAKSGVGGGGVVAAAGCKGAEAAAAGESLERMKKSLMKVFADEMDSLEIQLHEHCVKFQKFLDNEFETIDAIIKKKWDIFNVGDMNQIIKAICPDDSKSNCI